MPTHTHLLSLLTRPALHNQRFGNFVVTWQQDLEVRMRPIPGDIIPLSAEYEVKVREVRILPPSLRDPHDATVDVINFGDIVEYGTHEQVRQRMLAMVGEGWSPIASNIASPAETMALMLTGFELLRAFQRRAEELHKVGSIGNPVVPEWMRKFAADPERFEFHPRQHRLPSYFYRGAKP